MAKTKIYLEDNGQDCTWLLCDEGGTIVDAGPFQGDIWKGGIIPVWNNYMMQVGQPCPIHNAFIRHGFLKHKIEKIETI